jgi:galactose mutarotase-like enzyme
MAEETFSKRSTAELSATTWFGQEAVKLENASLQVVVVPEMGAKIVSLLDKHNQVEWLVGPGDHPFEPAPYGSVFTDQDMSGWDEMFPTINACQYPNPNSDHVIQLPDHGEVWAIPWHQKPTNSPALSFYVEGRALPYLFSREIEFDAESVLKFSYCATNPSDDPISVLWAAHPQFLVDSKARIILPPQISQVCNVLPEEFGWGALEEWVNWPTSTRPDGETLGLDVVGPPELNRARKFYVPPESRASWVTVLREASQDWISLSWKTEEIPYLGVWVDEGYISAETVVAPEPSTGYYDSLALAVEKGKQMVIQPGERVTWSLLIHFGDQHAPFPKA